MPHRVYSGKTRSGKSGEAQTESSIEFESERKLMKCILCGKRKGKRFCPAKRREICAQCCGEKRVVEVACPSDCTYLTSGQTYQSVKKYINQLQHQDDPVRQRRLYESLQRFKPLIEELEKQIITYGEDLTSFQDQHVFEAVTLLRETYETESKGIIYQHESSNPIVQSLSRSLHEELERLRQDPEWSDVRLRTADILDCLEVLDSDVRYHLEKKSDAETYLTFIRRNHPDVASGGPESRLIYP